MAHKTMTKGIFPLLFAGRSCSCSSWTDLEPDVGSNNQTAATKAAFILLYVCTSAAVKDVSISFCGDLDQDFPTFLKSPQVVIAQMKRGQSRGSVSPRPRCWSSLSRCLLFTDWQTCQSTSPRLYFYFPHVFILHCMLLPPPPKPPPPPSPPLSALTEITGPSSEWEDSVGIWRAQLDCAGDEWVSPAVKLLWKPLPPTRRSLPLISVSLTRLAPHGCPVSPSSALDLSWPLFSKTMRHFSHRQTLLCVWDSEIWPGQLCDIITSGR